MIGGSIFLFIYIGVIALAVVLFLMALVKWVQTDRAEIGGVSRGLWLVIILLTSPIGPAVFLYMLSADRKRGAEPHTASQAPYGETLR